MIRVEKGLQDGAVAEGLGDVLDLGQPQNPKTP